MAGILIDKLLAACVKQGASDIHLTVGQPPVFRLHGRMRKLETKEVSLQGQGRLESGKAAPVDITALMESLAASEVITKNFPRVDGANVIRKPGKQIDAVTFVAKCSKPRW